LGVFHRNEHVIRTKEAILWTLFWITLALLFSIFVYYAYHRNWFGIGMTAEHAVGGREATLKYITGYIIEKSLSLDNIFVIAMIFAYFKIPGQLQHRVLFWGILGALIMRGIMIAGGVALINRFSWMIYVFGILLIVTAVRMLLTKEEEIEPDKNLFIRIARRFFAVSARLHGNSFFYRENRRTVMTPLFLVLLVIESTDVLFAVDSIPAIFAVTTDPFLVFTSNVFAILGLRSLYFALAAMMDKFRYIKMSLVFILAYVGLKMILSHLYPIPTLISLAIIVIALTIGIMASVRADKNETASAEKQARKKIEN